MQLRGHGTSKASGDNGSKRNGRPSHQLTYKPSLEDYFFAGPSGAVKRSLGAGLVSQRSKSTSAAINRALDSDDTFHGPNLPAQIPRESKSSFSKAKFQWMKGELIGKGSHGKVYMGLISTGEIMAVKQVELPETPSDRMKGDMKKIVDALLDERETLKNLDHDNIVQYLGFEENRETLNIFLEYVSGGTIGTCLRLYGMFQEEVTKHFATQILEGLTYLHSQGIIHRDLKSENILVEESGVCKISDFGISKKLAELDRAYTFQGTSHWMAPEVMSSEGYDAKIDIWSVGCVVFEMWTAKRPWYDQVFATVMLKLFMNKCPPPLPEDCHLSAMAEEFRKKCFHPDPRNRPPASLLRMDPYLQMPDGWLFPGMLNIGRRVSMVLMNESDREIFEVGEILSRGVDVKSFQQRSSSPAIASLHSGILDTNSAKANYPPTIQPPINPLISKPPLPPPPIVTIEPLGPRKQKSQRRTDWMARERSSSSTSESSAGSHRSSQSASRNTRRLVVYNPDSDNERPQKRSDTPQPKPYVYVPPPLPDVGVGPVPYSVHLAPLLRNRFANPIPSPQSGLLAAPSPHYGGHSSPNRPFSSPEPPLSILTTSDESFTDGDSDFSTSSSTWKKPPADIANSARYLSKKAIALLGETRPAAREVVEHLANYFPDHDLDEPVVQSPLAPTDAYGPDPDKVPSKRFTMKSVKAIAEEQMSSPIRRRQTRLWDSHVEEIKAPR